MINKVTITQQSPILYTVITLRCQHHAFATVSGLMASTSVGTGAGAATSVGVSAGVGASAAGVGAGAALS